MSRRRPLGFPPGCTPMLEDNDRCDRRPCSRRSDRSSQRQYRHFSFPSGRCVLHIRDYEGFGLHRRVCHPGICLIVMLCNLEPCCWNLKTGIGLSTQRPDSWVKPVIKTTTPNTKLAYVNSDAMRGRYFYAFNNFGSTITFFRISPKCLDKNCCAEGKRSRCTSCTGVLFLFRQQYLILYPLIPVQ